VGGHLADRWGSRTVIVGCILLVAASFAIFLGGSWSLLLLAVGVLTLDIGVQGALVSNHTRVFALDPLAQNRINSLFTSSMFIGGAAGAAGAALAWSDGRWPAVCASAPFSQSRPPSPTGGSVAMIADVRMSANGTILPMQARSAWSAVPG
jgi:predicted MFS family arabinose efflux permease